MGLESSNVTIAALLFTYAQRNRLNLTYYATCGGVGLLYELKGSIRVAIFWFFSGLFFFENFLPKGTRITLVPSIEQIFKLSPEELVTKFGKLTFLTGRFVTLPELESLVIASNTPKNLMLEYFNKKI